MTVVEDNLVIKNVPTTSGKQTFATVLNLTFMKQKMKELDVRETDYHQFSKMYL